MQLFSTKFNVGSFLTKHGYGGDSSNATLRKMEKGLSVHLSGNGYVDYIETAQRLDTLLATGQNFTGEVWFKIDATQPEQQIWSFTNQVGDRFALGIQHHIATACTLRWSELGGDAVSGGGLGWGIWYHCIFTLEDATMALYLNNAELGGTVANGSHTATNRFVIGSASDLMTAPFYGQVGKLAFWDYIFTDAERDRSYEAFLAAKPLGFLKYPMYNPHLKSHDLSYLPGILAAWNFILSSGNIFTDISDWGGNASVHGAIPTKDGAKLNGVDNTVRLWMSVLQADLVKTVCFRIKLDSTTEVILQGETADHYIYANAGTLTYPDYENAYINGVDTDTIQANQWMNVVVTSSAVVSNATATLGLNDVTYGAFEIEDLRLFDYEFTAQQAMDYNIIFAKCVVFVENLLYAPVGDSLPTGWVVESGTFSVKEDSTGKYISGDGVGAISIGGVDLSNAHLREGSGKGYSLVASSNGLTVNMVTGGKLRNIVYTAGDLVSAGRVEFFPLSISGLKVWFDPTDTDNMILESIPGGWNGAGDYVQRWTDKISGAQVQEGTDIWQPYYDATNNKLICADNQRLLALNSVLTGLDNVITVVFLFKRNAPIDGVNDTPFELHDGLANGRKSILRDDGDVRHMSNAGVDFQANDDWTNTNWNTAFHVYNGAGSAFYRENVSRATGNSAVDSGLDRISILSNRTGGDKCDGSLGDFLIYGRALLPAELTLLQTWLDARK